jgi:hypothetical protein
VHSYVDADGIAHRNTSTCPLAGLTAQFECSEGVLKFLPKGFWHDGLVQVQVAEEHNVFETKGGYVISEDTQFYKCPFAESCTVDVASGKVTCSAGSEGVLCALCSDGYYANRVSSGEGEVACSKCTSTKAEILLPPILFVLGILLLVFVWVHWVSRIYHIWWANKWEKTFHKRPLDVIIVFKIILGFYQVLLLQPDVYDIPFPRLYLKWLGFMSFVALLDFDVTVMFNMDCLVRASYHSRLYIVACMSFFILVVVILALIRLRCIKTRGKAALARGRRLREQFNAQLQDRTASARKFLSSCLVISYLVYPSSSAVFFQTFNCRTIDGVRYHTKDLNIKCSSPAHRQAETVATGMIIFFSFGLPALYLSLLLWQRRGKRSLLAQQEIDMDFFVKDYKPKVGLRTRGIVRACVRACV